MCYADDVLQEEMCSCLLWRHLQVNNTPSVFTECIKEIRQHFIHEILFLKMQ